MEVRDILISSIEVSEYNVRKNLNDGQEDSTIEDLARSIAKQGLISPVTVFQRQNGIYGLIAGQRRLLACKHLGLTSIAAIVRTTEADATAISLIENVHRADMNPKDKATAFAALYKEFGNFETVSRETGVGVSTIRKYIQLLGLAPELQEQLAAGEARNTDALAKLAHKFDDQEKQVELWNRVKGFTQDVQREIIKRVDYDLDNLDELVGEATEGAFDMKLVRNCPFDCPTIPKALKEDVAKLIEAHSFKNKVKKKLKGDKGWVN